MMGALQRFTAAGAVIDYIDRKWVEIEAPGFTGQRTDCKAAVLKACEAVCVPIETSIRPYLEKRWAEVRQLQEKDRADHARVWAAIEQLRRETS